MYLPCLSKAVPDLFTCTLFKEGGTWSSNPGLDKDSEPGVPCMRLGAVYTTRCRFVLSPFTQENRNILKINHGGEPCKTLGIQVRNGSSLWICEASGQTAPWLVFSIVWSSVPWGWEEGTAYCQPLSSGGTLKESRPLECVSQHRASRGLPRPTVCFPFC